MYIAWGLSKLVSERETCEKLLEFLEAGGAFLAVEMLEGDSVTPAQSNHVRFLRFLYGSEVLPRSRIFSILKSMGITQIRAHYYFNRDDQWNEKDSSALKDYVTGKLKGRGEAEAEKILQEIEKYGLEPAPLMLLHGFKRKAGTGADSGVSKGGRKKSEEIAWRENARKKMLQFGPGELDEAELLSLVLDCDNELSQRILRQYGGRSLLKEKDLNQLSTLLGIDDFKTTELMALLEIGRRLFRWDAKAVPEIHSPAEAAKYLDDMRELKREHLRGLYLNIRGKIIYDEVVAIGTLNRALVSPRELLAPAIEYGASGLIIAHNHLSGIAEPSPDDEEMTLMIENAASLMKIDLWDHIIVTSDGYFSFNEAGKIKLKDYGG